MKKNIVVLYGGRSVEHDISIITAIQTMSNVDIVRYNAYPIYMKGGSFYHIANYEKISNYTDFEYDKHKRIIFDGNIIYELKGSKLRRGKKIDCALLCNHGGEGENGSLQGYLNLCGIAYTSADVLGSAIGMNKYIQKTIVSSEGIMTLPAVKINLSAYEKGKIDLENAYAKMGDKVIIKPVNLGSSIGISVASSIAEVKKAVELVSFYDGECMLERFLDGCEEYNCSLYKTDGELKYGKVEKVEKTHNFLSFDDKYIGDGSKGMAAQKRELVDGTLAEKIKNISKVVYDVLSLSGIVRIDYLMRDGDIYFNEVNTIPGSLSYYLYGDNFTNCISDIIDNAIKDANERTNKVISFNNSMLKSIKGTKGGKR